MAITHAFEYLKPKTVAQVLQYLKQYGKQARILAGGTDLINWLREGIVEPEAVIDIKGLKGLNKLTFTAGKLHIGSQVTFNDILQSKIISEKFPVFHEMALQVASQGIRNRATIAGNICSAVPCCDSGPILLIYDAEVVVTSSKGDKKIPIGSWFVGNKKTILKPGEFVREIIVPMPKEKNAGCYVKLRRYNGEDVAQASVAILMTARKTNIAFGAVESKPIRAQVIEKVFQNQKFSFDLLPEAIKHVPKVIAPITDIRASKEYRMHMVKIMLERAMKEAHARLQGQGSCYGTSLI